MTRQRIAVLGCGIMGAAMAHNLAAAKFDVRVWNRTRARIDDMHARGFALEAFVAQTAAEAVMDADFVLTMVSDGPALREVMAGRGGALQAARRGATWLQMATVGIEATDLLHGLAREAGVDYVDAPVLGTRRPAEQGTLTVIAAGDPSLRERCQGPFSAMSERTLWLDRVGDASRLKLVANQWSTGLVALMAETSTFARAIDVEIEQFLKLVGTGPFMAGYARTKAEMMARRDFEPSFPLDMAHKDVRLALESASNNGCRLPVTTAIEAQFDTARRAGHGRRDLSAVIEALRPGVGKPEPITRPRDDQDTAP